MILGGALLVALILVGVSRLRFRRKLRLRWVILATPFLWAAWFGIFRGLAFVTQRDLPGPNFTTPIPFYAGAAVPLAIATATVLALGRLRLLPLLVAQGALVIAGAAINYHACFTEEAILLRRCLSFTEQRYEYSQVKSLKHVRDRKLIFLEVHMPRFHIAFDDGTRWNSDEGFRRTSHLDMQSIHAVIDKSNVMLQQVQWE